ncbi:MAG: hypothetical protein MO852_06470 [Candidatus Devosia euplotis]|nr:hypothetical protein [Candidatus Devosia euplotis]
MIAASQSASCIDRHRLKDTGMGVVEPNLGAPILIEPIQTGDAVGLFGADAPHATGLLQAGRKNVIGQI